MNLLNFFDYFPTEGAEAKAKRQAIEEYDRYLEGLDDDGLRTEGDQQLAALHEAKRNDTAAFDVADEKLTRITAALEIRRQRELDHWDNFIAQVKLPDPMTSSWGFLQQFLTQTFEGLRAQNFTFLHESDAMDSPAMRRRLSKWQAAYLFRRLHEIDTEDIEDWLIDAEDPPSAFAYIKTDDYRRLLQRELARRDARG